MRSFSSGRHCLALLTALMQAVPAGHGLGNLFFLLKSFRKSPEGQFGLRPTWESFQTFRSVLIWAYLMTIVHILILLFHGGSQREFEAYAVWLLWPFVLAGLMKTRLHPTSFFWGVGLASCLSGIAALIDLIYLIQVTPASAFQESHGAFRIAGAMTNPIVFGNLSILLATLCLFFIAVPIRGATGRDGRHEKGTTGKSHQDRRTNNTQDALFVLGAALGFLGSLLSGTKGGWLAALMVWPLLLFYLGLQRGKGIFVLALSGIFVSFYVAVSLPMSTLEFRLINFYQSIHSHLSAPKGNTPIQTANDSPNQSVLVTPLDPQKEAAPAKTVPPHVSHLANTPDVKQGSGPNLDSSIGPRLVQWKLALSNLSIERFLVGLPRDAFIEVQRHALAGGEAQGLIRPWRNLHNDLIDTFVTKGIAGLLILVTFILVLLRFFYSHVKQKRGNGQTFAGAGLLSIFMVAIFSISDVQLDKGAVTHTLTFLLLTLTALILQHENELPAHRL